MHRIGHAGNVVGMPQPDWQLMSPVSFDSKPARVWAGVLSQEVGPIWGKVSPWIAQACRRGHDRYTPDDILSSLLEKKTQLWLAFRMGDADALAVTEILVYPQKRYGRILMGAGTEPDDIDDFITTLEGWARSLGCDGVESLMRPGFEPAFRRNGWKKSHVLMEKDF